MLEDADFPDTEAVLVEILTEARLGLVADSKGSKDLKDNSSVCTSLWNVFRSNPTYQALHG